VIGRTGLSAGITHDMADEARLGRLPGNDIVINSPFLSGHHARIFTEGGSHWIEDLGSRNGTRVDGVAVSRPVCLERLHVITLADAIDLLYVAAGAGAPADRAAATTPAERAAPAVVSHAPTDGPTGPPAGAAHAQPDASPSPQPETVYDLAFDPLVDPRASAGSGKSGESGHEVGERAEPGVVTPAPDPAPLASAEAETETETEPEPSAGFTMVSGLDSGPLIDPRGAAPSAAQAATPAPARQYALSLTLPDGITETFPLKRGENSLGRSADCDVMVPDPERWLSRHHATLTIRDDGATLADSDTMNGTFIAGVQIRSVEIAPDTTFRLGPNTELRFVET
jgi:pSer/pThr/pTyr-binding forkhead associated (FHA) protein